MSVTVQQQVLDAVEASIEGVSELTGQGLGPCVAALVGSGGAAGAALVRRRGGRLDDLARAGILPPVDVAVTGALVTGRLHLVDGLAAVPVRCLKGAAVVLVADVDGDPGMALVLRSTAAQLGLQLQLVQARKRVEAAEARSETLLSATQALSRTHG